MVKVKDAVLKLQALLKENKLDGYIVPSADPHQSEYVAQAFQRREFISGFSGSSGLFACTQAEAGVWTDGRYWVQAETELKGSGIELYRQGAALVADWKDWLAMKLKAGSRLGLNPHVFSMDQYQALEAKLTTAGIEIIPCVPDLIDQLWADARPSLPQAALRVHPESYAGETVGAKLQKVRDQLLQRQLQGLLVSALDEVAWLYNLRGSDVDYNPVFYGFAFVERQQAHLFVDLTKITQSVRDTLGTYVQFAAYEELPQYLANLAQSQAVWLDPASSSEALAHVLRTAGVAIHAEVSPLSAWKAVKNKAELEGMVQSHIRDGVALVRFLRWFVEHVPQGNHDEMTVAQELEKFRQMDTAYHGPSFATIAGYGEHGALPHYRSTEASNVPLKDSGIFLLDSGGQYADGTTDVTRTLVVGSPTAEQKEVYTRVLKGHLLLARSEFPRGTNGYQLDVLARQPLWQYGLDYGHGTGHGVGAALCVHEGPFSISLRKNMIPLELGHVVSNEPACYLVGEFGVRIENLVTVVAKRKTVFGDFLGFEDLTLCPYERRLINSTLLSVEEIAQVDRYHQRVWAHLSPLLSGADQEFLKKLCQPLVS